MTLAEFAQMANIDSTPAAIRTAIDQAMADVAQDDRIDDEHPRFFLHVAILVFGEDAGIEPPHPHTHAELNAVEREAIRRLHCMWGVTDK